MALLTWVLPLSALIALFAGLGVFVRWRGRRRAQIEAPSRPPLTCPPQSYSEPGGAAEEMSAFRRIVRESFERSGPSAAGSWRFEDQAPLWREALAAVGRRLEAARVDRIVLVHGTFVGDDPFSILATVRTLMPSLPPEVEKTIAALARSASRQFLRDHGNFLGEYAELLGRGLASTVTVERFSWSAGNHHWARLEAAVQLAAHLDTALARRLPSVSERGEPTADPPRVLLLGHSHAGQVFALLIQMLAEVSHFPELLAVAAEAGIDTDALQAQLGRLRHIGFDVVTLGTPPRYGWPTWAGYRLLHLINHRGSTTRAGSIRGVLHTTDGDYIQQWGIAGSDLPATDAKARKLNLRLDPVLGVGSDTKAWKGYLRAGLRVPSTGTTLLVDYRDASRVRPNAVDTFFGHSVYTRKRVMLFNFELIAEHLYPPRDVSSDEVRSSGFGQRLLGAWRALLGSRVPRAD